MSDEEKKPEDAEEHERSSRASAPVTPAPLLLERDERRARMLIIVGAAFMMFGILLALGDDELARWLTVAGMIISFIALHRFGRLGPAASVAR